MKLLMALFKILESQNWARDYAKGFVGALKGNKHYITVALLCNGTVV